MSRWMRLARMRPVWFTFLVVAAIVAYQIWVGMEADEKLQASGLGAGAGPSDVVVTMAMAPEQFHMVALQEAGRLVRVEDRRAFLRAVPPARVRSLARRYWITRVQRWSEES